MTEANGTHNGLETSDSSSTSKPSAERKALRRSRRDSISRIAGSKRTREIPKEGRRRTRKIARAAGKKSLVPTNPQSGSLSIGSANGISAEPGSKPVGGANKSAQKSDGPLALNKSASHKNASSNSALARKKSARRRNNRRKMPVPLLYFSRLAIVGLGIAAIGGTLLKVLPSSSAQNSSRNGTQSAEVAANNSAAETAKGAFPIELNQEIAALKSQMQELPNLYPDLTPKAFFVDVYAGDYVNLEGGDSFGAASTIKLPILLAFFEEVDEGRIDLDQTIAILPEQIAEGSGDMQISPPGTQFTVLEVATQMIVNSDNTATNMMIDLLGGQAALNERFIGYGLQKTKLNEPLPDLDGTNTTSARDLAHTMVVISGDRLSMRSRDRILNILNRTRNKNLLAAGMVEKEALTYNKTGDIGAMLGDVSLVDLSNGKRYVVAVLVERPINDGRAVELIHRISDMTFQQANEAIRPAVTPLGDPGSLDRPERPTGDLLGEDEATGASNTLEEDPYPSANPSRRPIAEVE